MDEEKMGDENKKMVDTITLGVIVEIFRKSVMLLTVVSTVRKLSGVVLNQDTTRHIERHMRVQHLMEQSSGEGEAVPKERLLEMLESIKDVVDNIKEEVKVIY